MSSRVQAPFVSPGNLDLAPLAVAGTALFVDSASGDDVSGDGSSSNPFASVQRAVREIPNTEALNDGFVFIQCVGVGPYSFDNDNLVIDLPRCGQFQIYILGDLGSPVSAFGSVSWSLKAGKSARYEASPGAWSEAASLGSHVIAQLIPFGGVDFPLLNVVDGDNSDNVAGTLEAISNVTPTSGDLYRIQTVVSGTTTRVRNDSQKIQLFFYGIKFQATNFYATGRVEFAGCFVDAGGIFLRAGARSVIGFVASGAVVVDDGGHMGLFPQMAGLFQAGIRSGKNRSSSFTGLVSRQGIVAGDSQSSFTGGTNLTLNKVDIEPLSSVPGLVAEAASNVTIVGLVTFGGNTTSPVECKENSLIRVDVSPTGSGSAPSKTEEGGKILGASSMAGNITNTTTPGDEITNGALATKAFSAIAGGGDTDPAQLCRVT